MAPSTKSNRPTPDRPLTVADAKALRMKDPITVLEAARVLRIRYPVALRLVKKGVLRGRQIGARYFVERGDLARVAKEKPWAPWAMRKHKGYQRPTY